jgi:PKHD-type hydroxylase
MSITRGACLASSFWVRSLLRDDNQRAMLFDLDAAIQQLTKAGIDDSVRRSLVSEYYNILRIWTLTGPLSYLVDCID